MSLLHADHSHDFSPGCILGETALDLLRLLPFLFLACLLSEWISRSARRARAVISGSGRLGPLFGSLLGLIPQCGLSAAAARLYAARLLSLGTLLAVFLSTSDEMLPILLAGGLPIPAVLRILGVKCLSALVLGFAVDGILRLVGFEAREPELSDLPDMPCDCGCCSQDGGSGWVSLLLGAIRHTLTISFYLFFTMLAFECAVALVGEARLAELLADSGMLGVLLSALCGLIPSCAVSVVLTELFLAGAVTAGALFAGLSVGAGVGLLVLFRTNRPLRENLAILSLLLLLGIGLGALVDLTGLGKWLV